MADSVEDILGKYETIPESEAAKPKPITKMEREKFERESFPRPPELDQEIEDILAGRKGKEPFPGPMDKLKQYILEKMRPKERAPGELGIWETDPTEQIPIVGPMMGDWKTRQIIKSVYPDLSGPELEAKVQEAIQERREKRESWERQHPWAAFGLGAAVTAPLAPISGVGPVMRGVSAITKSPALRGAARIGAIGAEGAGITYGDFLARGYSPDQAAKAAKIAGTLGVSLPVAGALATKGKETGVHAVFGVLPEHQRQYAKNPQAVMAENKYRLTQDVQEAQIPFRLSAFQESEKLRSAENTARDAIKFNAQNKKYLADQAAIQLEDRVLNDAQELRQRITDRATKSFNALRNAPPVKTKDIRNIVYQEIVKFAETPRSLAPRSRAIQSDPAYNELLGIYGSLNKKIAADEKVIPPVGHPLYPEMKPVAKVSSVVSSLPAEEVKRLIMDLDNATATFYAKKMRGEYTSQPERSLKRIRDRVRSLLSSEKYPEYNKIMEQLADDTKKMENFQELIGNRRNVAKGISNIYANLNHKELVALKDFQKKVGEFKPEYMEQYDNLMDAIEDYHFFTSNPEYRQRQERKLTESVQLQNQRAVAENALKEKANFASTAPETLYNAATEAVKNEESKKFGVSKQEALDKLRVLLGPNIDERIRNVKANEGLIGGVTQGSRRTGMMTGLGVTASKFLFPGSSAADFVLGGAGGMAGMTLDVSGRRIYRFLADIAAHPAYRGMSGVIRESIKAGPKSFAQTINLLSSQNQDFADYMQQYLQENEGEQ